MLAAPCQPTMRPRASSVQGCAPSPPCWPVVAWTRLKIWCAEGQSVARARGPASGRGHPARPPCWPCAACGLGALVDAEAECRTALTVMAGQSWADPIPALTLLTEALLAQGRLTEAADIQAGADGHPARRGLVGALAVECRARLSVALGQTQSGLDALVLAGREADRCGIVNPALTSWRAETAPVLASLGMGDQSRILAAANLDMARAFGSPRPLGLALRAAGLVAEPALRKDLLAQSVSVLERSPAQYDLALLLVDLGGTLRRSGDLGQARERCCAGAPTSPRSAGPSRSWPPPGGSCGRQGADRGASPSPVSTPSRLQNRVGRPTGRRRADERRHRQRARCDRQDDRTPSGPGIPEAADTRPLRSPQRRPHPARGRTRRTTPDPRGAGQSPQYLVELSADWYSSGRISLCWGGRWCRDEIRRRFCRTSRGDVDGACSVRHRHRGPDRLVDGRATDLPRPRPSVCSLPPVCSAVC